MVLLRVTVTRDMTLMHLYRLPTVLIRV